MDEQTCKYRAWQVAKETNAHQVVIQRGEAIFRRPLDDNLDLQRGDTILALVSPYSEQPKQECPEAAPNL